MRCWRFLLCLTSCGALALPGTAVARPPGSGAVPIAVIRYTSEEDLARHLQEAIASDLADRKRHLSQPRVLFNTPDRPPQGSVLQARQIAEKSDRVPMRFELVERGTGQPQRWAVTLVGRMEQDALVATRAIARGAALDCGFFEAQRRPSSGQSDQEVAPCAVPPGAVSRRFLSAGDALRFSDIGEQVAVAEMASVMIKVAVGQVVLESPGLALENGIVGQRIRVRPGTSRQAVFATVTGPGSVAIEESGASQ